ncbi:LysR family transcriptional regulator [Salipiger sp. P9]|uniref:LysR family transcriptional regulator n=1 Tax=Salipiger pentaromativorans TaxID=2943193 RepID=UPI002157EB97|nr:LysR family transcriptional regulator [Salipiger pentaromativorans]MCR8547931.1 LysR family transcriptional regulator [Salipiger pentaromativorans]
MNESHFSLDDLLLLLDVADAGSLTGAAQRRGVPLPTLSRRMTRLERDSGRVLFLRGKAGYALTAEGRALAAEAAELRAVRRRVALWADAGHGPAPVRITAGTWTSRHLARALSPGRNPLWLPLFLPSNAPLDLARREADIGIRNRPPDSSRLARRRLRRIGYAVYGSSAEVTGYVAQPDGPGLAASQRWLRAEHGDEIATTASDLRLCLDLALAGFGRVVLPCFAGDAETGLRRLSDPIAALAHDEWLVSHHEARHDPPVRAALDTIARTLSAAPPGDD